jgi:hypothetical protein
VDIDFELQLRSFPRAGSADLCESFVVEMEGDGELRDVVLRAEREVRPPDSLDAAMADWLRNLEAHAQTVRQCNATIRLGMFYNVKETVVFPFRLSAQTIHALSNLNLGISATGYPCDDEPAETD